MKVKVEACWNGLSHYFRCTFPDGNRINVGRNFDGDPWSREMATELRDYAVGNYGVSRNSVKVV